MRLPVPARVDLKVVSRDEARAALLEVLRRDYPGDLLERLAESLAAVGLVAPGTDLRAEAQALYGGNVSGFYDPHRRLLYLLSDQPLAAQASIVAHELAHAVQDEAVRLDAAVFQGARLRGRAAGALRGHRGTGPAGRGAGAGRGRRGRRRGARHGQLPHRRRGGERGDGRWPGLGSVARAPDVLPLRVRGEHQAMHFFFFFFFVYFVQVRLCSSASNSSSGVQVQASMRIGVVELLAGIDPGLAQRRCALRRIVASLPPRTASLRSRSRPPEP